MIPVANTSALSIATSLTARLVLRFDETDWTGLYDRVEVWRSRLTDAGPYEEVTGIMWTPAMLSCPGASVAPRFAPIVGKELDLLINEATPLTLTFTGVDPLSAADVASQIQLAGFGLLAASAQPDGSVLISTLQPGASAVLRAVGGNAAPILGLPLVEPGSIGFGTDPRILLQTGVRIYTFIDPHGSEAYFYKTRFRNGVTGGKSAFSPPFSAKTNVGIEPEQLVRGTTTLVDGGGKPMLNRRILVSVPNQYLTVSGKTIFGTDQTIETDARGYAELYLVRGARFRFAVSGTQMVREVTAPTDSTVTTFDLFDPQYGTDDIYKVQVPNVDYAVRRTL